MTTTKLFPSGALEVSDIIDGLRVHVTYHGYTKKEAAAMFRQEFPKRRKKK